MRPASTNSRLTGIVAALLILPALPWTVSSNRPVLRTVNDLKSGYNYAEDVKRSTSSMTSKFSFYCLVNSPCHHHISHHHSSCQSNAMKRSTTHVEIGTFPPHSWVLMTDVLSCFAPRRLLRLQIPQTIRLKCNDRVCDVAVPSLPPKSCWCVDSPNYKHPPMTFLYIYEVSTHINSLVEVTCQSRQEPKSKPLPARSSQNQNQNQS